MVGRSEVKQLACAIEGVTDDSSEERIIFSHDGRGIAWTFMQRDHPKQKRWPNLDVLAVSCTLEQKELLVEAAPDIYFDDPHYRGYPAVLVRLPVIEAGELAHRFREAVAFHAAKPKRKKR